MTYFLRHQCSCSWVENSSKTTPETPHRYTFDNERQHAMSRRNISRKRRKKKPKNNHSLNLQSRPTANKVPALSSRAYASGTVTSVRRQLRRSWVKQRQLIGSQLYFCVIVLKCKLCCYSSISLLSSSSNTNDFLVVSKSSDVTSV